MPDFQLIHGGRSQPLPPAFHIGSKATITPVPLTQIDEDPRGLLWMYEPPSTRSTYVMGVDPSNGRTNWNRFNRTDDDYLTDNGAIEVIRIGHKGSPDVQVAEYAAPIDPYDLAAVANAIGRLYAGNNEDEQCLSIVEVWPGPGLPCQREMIDRFGYTNQFLWMYGDSMVPKQTASYGWQSNQKSVRDLWIKGIRHISNHSIQLKSPWLVEELADAEMDMEKMRGRAIYGSHDDRVSALLMAIWAGHQWSYDIETNPEPAEIGLNDVEWQATDISLDRLMDAWEDRWEEIANEKDY
jgi:hypothetical protein